MRRMATTVVTTVLLSVLLAPAALASHRPSVYLSLGTSLAAGSQADAVGNTTFGSDQSYTDQLYRKVRGRFGGRLRHVKLGCAGETTDQFLGGLNAAGEPSACAGQYRTGSQVGDALETIASQRVAFITIDIGANDVLQAQTSCAGDPACIGAAIPVIAAKVAQVVGAIRAGGFDGPILGMNYYNPQVASAIGFYPGVAGQQNPDVALAMSSDILARGLNGALEQVFAAFDVEVVDVYSAFNAGDFGDDRPANGAPDNVDRLCRLSYMCPRDGDVKSNIHLNRRGYGVVAREFFRELRSIDRAA